MDELERTLSQRFGSGMVPAEEVRAALRQAADKHLIDPSAVTDLGPMKTAELCEHISRVRREFLYQTLPSLDVEPLNRTLSASYPSSSGEYDPELIDKALTAYFQYAKGCGQKKQRYTRYVFILALIVCSFLFGTYIPEPY